jgi:HD-like signal output (HDOD) protein
MFDRLRHRLGQTQHFLRPSPPTDDWWRELLSPEAAQQFSVLSPGDQQHAVSVAGALHRQGAPIELVRAGLLHDVGKAVPGTTIRLIDRVAKVVLERLAPHRLGAIANWTHPRWPLKGLWALSRHAGHGEALVRRWGYGERVAWLVGHHEDAVVTDPDLALLVAIDDGRPLPSRGAGKHHG